MGVDLGSTGKRKVTIKTAWGTFKTINNSRPGKKILAVPSNLLTFRKLNFPFQDKRRIMEILPGELMESLAFPLDKATWDVFSIERGGASVLVMPADQLDRVLDTVDEQVQFVEAEPCALARVAKYNDVEDTLIIDFGATKTSFYGIRNGNLDMMRVRLVGGDKLDSIIASGEGINKEEAEELKKSLGMDSRTVKRYYDSLLDSAFLSSSPGYDKVIITGGGSKTPKIAEFISKKWDVEVTFFNLPKSLSPHFDAVAFGAALYETVGKQKVNLKKTGEESESKSYYWLLLLLIPVILYSINLKLTQIQLVQENRQLRRAMSEAVRKEFPDIGRVVSPLMQVKALIAREESSGNGDQVNVLEVLTNISRAREGIEVNFYEMDISGSNAKLKGESDSFQSVDNLRKSLEGYFSSAEVIEQKSKPGGKVDFSIELELTDSGQ